MLFSTKKTANDEVIRSWHSKLMGLLALMVTVVNDTESVMELRKLRNYIDTFDTRSLMKSMYNAAKEHAPNTIDLVNLQDADGLLRYAKEQSSTKLAASMYMSYQQKIVTAIKNVPEHSQSQCWMQIKELNTVLINN